MDEQISELKVLRSAAGYYIGEDYWDSDFQCWMPYSRRSMEYYKTYEEAQEALDKGTYSYRSWA